MLFDERRCAIPKIYCGNAIVLPQGYIRVGTRHECLRQGIGAGIHTEQEKHLPRDSLKRIKYVGDIFEENFHRNGIDNTGDLLEVMRNLGDVEKKRLLKRVFTKANGTFDGRSYNSTLLWLHSRHITRLPRCKDLFR